MKHRNPALHAAIVADLKTRVGRAVREARHARAEGAVKPRTGSGQYVTERGTLTQRALAARVGVSDKIIAGVESGNHLLSLPLFRQLCLSLNLDANDLLGISPRRTYIRE